MRFFTTLLLAVAAGLLVYAIRGRIKLALTVAAVAYVVLLPLRLAATEDLVERIEGLVLPAAAVLTVWAGLWWLSTRYYRRRSRDRRSRPRRQ